MENTKEIYFSDSESDYEPEYNNPDFSAHLNYNIFAENEDDNSPRNNCATVETAEQKNNDESETKLNDDPLETNTETSAVTNTATNIATNTSVETETNTETVPGYENGLEYHSDTVQRSETELQQSLQNSLRVMGFMGK